MPDRGLRSFEGLALPGLNTSATAVLVHASWMQITFEVDRETALSYLPCAVSRPIPTYARFLFVTSTDMSLAIASVGGRYRMLPRNVVVSAVNPANLLAGTFGLGSEAGSARLTREGAHLDARASTEDTSFDATVDDLYAIEPSMLRWDPYLVVGERDSGAELAEVTISAIPERAFLSKYVTMTPGQDAPKEHPWRRLRSLGLISACYVEGALTFSAPEPQESLA